MQQITHLFYAMAFLVLGSGGQPVDWSAPVPDFGEYQQRMWAGDVDVSDQETKVVYCKVHWLRLLHNVRQKRYRESLNITAERSYGSWGLR